MYFRPGLSARIPSEKIAKIWSSILSYKVRPCRFQPKHPKTRFPAAVWRDVTSLYYVFLLYWTVFLRAIRRAASKIVRVTTDPVVHVSSKYHVKFYEFHVKRINYWTGFLFYYYFHFRSNSFSNSSSSSNSRIITLLFKTNCCRFVTKSMRK